MSYFFSCYGHSNITSKHKNTFEFTKDLSIRKEADCIIGVRADYSLDEIKKIINNKEKIKIIIKVDDLVEEVNCELNKDFNDPKEIVVRKSDFNSKRTFGIRADKACIDFSREFVDKLKDCSRKIAVNLI